jgi:hypothetical protein
MQIIFTAKEKEAIKSVGLEPASFAKMVASLLEISLQTDVNKAKQSGFTNLIKTGGVM